MNKTSQTLKKVNTGLKPYVFLPAEFFKISKEIEVQRKENSHGSCSSYSYYIPLGQSKKQNTSIEEVESFISPVVKEFKSKGSIDEVFGLWKDRNISLDEIREQQWGRKIN